LDEKKREAHQKKKKSQAKHGDLKGGHGNSEFLPLKEKGVAESAKPKGTLKYPIKRWDRKQGGRCNAGRIGETRVARKREFRRKGLC